MHDQFRLNPNSQICFSSTPYLVVTNDLIVWAIFQKSFNVSRLTFRLKPIRL